ncbi:WG repeat-containing protein [Bradyrhizobium tropiciagri]|uniref:WG repeat-containing protein n=1 Tax=Bradyrhizobium tropiciagri TaxID=312253 RepID=UPI001BABB112|nr:WG repeat-containing protein [Bradyrhizobium tropiciagri]MBR0873458.1 WG repeat-containing protein [Bradyrhizobium tropiciagri]
MNSCFRLLAGAVIMLAAAQDAFGQSAAGLPRTVGSEGQADLLESLARKKGDALIPTCRFEGARCGYIDRNGNTVVAPQFEWADRFVADRALVRSAGKYGAIDATGRFVIDPAYDQMSSLDHSLALVVVGNRMGVIDENGQSIVPAEYGAIIRLSLDAFLVAEPFYVDSRRRLEWPSSYLTPHAYGKRWGIVASGGSWIVRPVFAQVQLLSDDPNGLFWAANPAHTDARWQLMDLKGVPVNDDRFDQVQKIQRGQDRAIVSRGKQWGAVDGKGEIVVPLKFDWLGYFRDGWAPYRLAGREGRIDRDGNILSDEAARPSSLDGKLGAVVDGKPLYTDQAGTRLLGTDHPKCPDGRHLDFARGHWTIMAADDRPAPDTAFEYVELACNAPSIVKHDVKWGFILTDGTLLAGRYFDRANAFHDGIATISEKGQWAVIGEDGSFLLGPLKLARGIVTSGAGEYSIEFEEGYRTLDKSLIAELARNPDVLTRRLTPRLPWSEGLAAKLDDGTGKWGFVDPAGKFVIAPQFDAVSSFNDGAAWAAFPDRREWCQIDKAGQIKPDVKCRCHQPLVILERDRPPADIACYDYGIRIVRGLPVIRGMAK